METDQIRARFSELKGRWKRETAGVSSVTRILLNPNYLKIIGLGPQVVPFILESLQNEPDHWFAALQALTDYDPGPCGSFDATRGKWLEWAEQQGFFNSVRDTEDQTPIAKPEETGWFSVRKGGFGSFVMLGVGLGWDREDPSAALMLVIGKFIIMIGPHYPVK
jgi:hypothetical protein